MARMEQQLVFDVNELRAISIQCPKCHAELTIDDVKELKVLPKECPNPNCDQTWFRDAGLQDPATQFVTWLKNLRKSGRFKITFRIPWPATEAPKGQKPAAEVSKGQ